MPGKLSSTLIKAEDFKGLNLKNNLIKEGTTLTGLESVEVLDGSGNKHITLESRERDHDNASHEKWWLDDFLVDIAIGLGVVIFVFMAWLIVTPNAVSKLTALVK